VGPNRVPVPPERSTRARQAAGLLPLLGLFLLMPPVIGLFAAPAELAGVPLIVLYLFAAWLGLVLAAARLARSLELPAPPREPEQAPPP
jgi:hypothetical protein